MRRLLTFIVLPVLLAAASWLYWQHAYELEPDFAPVGFRPGEGKPYVGLGGAGAIAWDAGRGWMTVRSAPGGPAPAAMLPLAGWPASGFAHVRIKGHANALAKGDKKWELGRVLLVWQHPDGGFAEEYAGLAEFSGNDSGTGESMVPLDVPSSPRVLIQNFGRSGEFVIEELRVTLVRHRAWAPWAAAGLVVAWWGWLVWILRRIAPGARWWRLGATGALGVVALMAVAFPGPWKPYHPILAPFQIAAAEHGAVAAQSAGKVEPAMQGKVEPGATAPAAGLPGELKEGILWKIFETVKRHARWPMHAAAFAVLATVIVVLLGAAGGAWLVVFTAIASEAMQVLFGFGATWEDILDLAADGAGICLGVWMATRFARKWWQKAENTGG